MLIRVEIKFMAAFVLNRRVHLHAIDATRLLDGVAMLVPHRDDSMAASSPVTRRRVSLIAPDTDDFHVHRCSAYDVTDPTAPAFTAAQHASPALDDVAQVAMAGVLGDIDTSPSSSPTPPTRRRATPASSSRAPGPHAVVGEFTCDPALGSGSDARAVGPRAAARRWRSRSPLAARPRPSAAPPPHHAPHPPRHVDQFRVAVNPNLRPGAARRGRRRGAVVGGNRFKTPPTHHASVSVRLFRSSRTAFDALALRQRHLTSSLDDGRSESRAANWWFDASRTAASGASRCSRSCPPRQAFVIMHVMPTSNLMESTICPTQVDLGIVDLDRRRRVRMGGRRAS